MVLRYIKYLSKIKSSSLPPTLPNSASTLTLEGAQASTTALVTLILSSNDSLC